MLLAKVVFVNTFLHVLLAPWKNVKFLSLARAPHAKKFQFGNKWIFTEKMARKRNEEYIGEDDDGEFEEEPVESFEDPPDYVDKVSDEGEPRIQKCGTWIWRRNSCFCENLIIVLASRTQQRESFDVYKINFSRERRKI